MNIPKILSYLSEFISEYPLYSKFGTDQPLEAEDLNNLEFDFLCKNEHNIQTFRLEATSYTIITRFNSNGVTGAIPTSHLLEETKNGFTEMFSGICQSCKNYQVTIVISSGIQKEKPKYFIRKIGQYPPPKTPEPRLPKEIHYFLNDESRELYNKALKNLESGFGTGAFAYFKRMIENEIGRIIEAVSTSCSSGRNKISEAVEAYKQDQQRTKLVEDITACLPESLKEHGANVLLLLYDVTSSNMHELTEEEYIKKSKDIDTMFRYLVKKINGEKNETISLKVVG